MLSFYQNTEKHDFSILNVYPPKNTPNGNIWDRGLIEQDTAQLSSLSNAFVGHQKR